MISHRAARFIEPEAVWQNLEHQEATADADGLAEFLAGHFGAGDLYLGIVRATGERAFWIKTTDRQSEIPSGLPEAVWSKKIVQPDHTLLVVVLTELDMKANFVTLTLDVLAALQQSASEPDAATLLVARLQQWQPATVAPLGMAA